MIMKAFYTQELDQRRRLGYPPFYQIVRSRDNKPVIGSAQRTASQLVQKIIGWVEASGRPATEVIGPVPCYFGRLNNLFRWQIVLRGVDPAGILKEHMGDLAGVHVEINPPNLL